jgi:hypothetical protein
MLCVFPILTQNVYTIPWKYSILGKRTKKKQSFCKLGEKGEIKEDGKHHITITQGTNYQ